MLTYYLLYMILVNTDNFHNHIKQNGFAYPYQSISNILGVLGGIFIFFLIVIVTVKTLPGASFCGV